jgi:hypothetical protein
MGSVPVGGVPDVRTAGGDENLDHELGWLGAASFLSISVTLWLERGKGLMTRDISALVKDRSTPIGCCPWSRNGAKCGTNDARFLSQ